jgi:apolipoprotein N-acyltransferase
VHKDRSIFIHPVDQWKRILSYLPDKKEKLDLIVLPEGALPFGINHQIYNKFLVQTVFEEFHPDAANLFSEEGMNKKQLWQTNQYWCEQLSKYYQCPVIIGLEAREDENIYNAAFYFTEKQKVQRYEKCILVPGSEYMPFEWGKKLAINYGIVGSFCKGKGLKVFSDPVPLSISICYEETYGHFMRKAKQIGAHLLVNITNDMWFSNSKLPQQHFHLGKLRAIENGIPALRACNSGVTAVIDSLGRVVKTLHSKTSDFQDLSGCLFSRVSSYHYATFYSLFGDISIISLSTLFCFFAFILRKKKK